MSRGSHAVYALTFWAAICSTSALAADPVVFKRFDSGTSLGTIGMIGASEDAPIDGPQAIYAADDGGVYLLDQLNGRVLRFDSKKSDAEVHSLTLPSDLRPTDLVVRKGSVYVWDGDVHALQAGGRPGQSVRGLSETRSADPTDDFTRTAFSQMGSQTLDPPVELLDDSTRGLPAQPRRTPTRQFVDSRGAGPVIADIAAGKDDSIAQIEVRKKGQLDLLAKLNVQVRDRLGAVEFLEVDANGRMFVLTENIPMTAAAAAAYVARFSPQGVLESIYDIPLSESVALSRRFVTVSPDGDVFFLRTRETGVDVLGVGARAVRKGGIIDDPSARRAPVARGKGKNAAIAAVRPLTRKRVIETALAFESSRWQLTKASYGEDPDLVCTGFQRVRRPGYLNGRQNQEVQGIPYCWGCMGSLPQIRASLSRGALAGNVCTRNAPRTDVVGVDCSAFVSATWGLATHFTTAAIPAIAAEVVNPWDMLPGDALNKAGTHVMLFLRFTPDRKVEVMESSTGACNGRVCRSIYPLSSLLARGYVPVRYRALAEDTAVAAAPANAAADPNSGKKEAAKGAPAQKRARQTSARPER